MKKDASLEIWIKVNEKEVPIPSTLSLFHLKNQFQAQR